MRATLKALGQHCSTQLTVLIIGFLKGKQKLRFRMQRYTEKGIFEFKHSEPLCPQEFEQVKYKAWEQQHK